MRYVNFFALVFLVVVIGNGVQANAQDAVKSKAAAEAPAGNASLALNLSDVAIFKSSSSEEGKVVISMAGQSSSAQNPTATTGYRTETRTRLVPVTKMRAETRTRLVTVDNKQVPKTYTVQVPYTVSVTQTYTVQVPVTKMVKQTGSESGSGKRKTKSRFVDMTSLTAWDLTGKPIPEDQLASRLQKPLTAFLIEQPFGPSVKINSAHLAVLRDDVMLIQVAKKN